MRATSHLSRCRRCVQGKLDERREMSRRVKQTDRGRELTAFRAVCCCNHSERDENCLLSGWTLLHGDENATSSRNAIKSIIGNNWGMDQTYRDRSGNASSPHRSPGRPCCSHSVYTNHTHKRTDRHTVIQTHTHVHTHKHMVGWIQDICSLKL